MTARARRDGGPSALLRGIAYFTRGMSREGRLGTGLAITGLALIAIPAAERFGLALSSQLAASVFLGGAITLICGIALVIHAAVPDRRVVGRGLRVAGERLWERSPIDITRRHRPPPEPPARGFLDFEKDWQTAMDDINATLPKIANELEKNTPRVQKHAARLAAAKGTKIDVRIKRARESARNFNRHAESLERLERRLRAGVRAMVENYMALLDNATTRANVSNPGVLTSMKSSTAEATASVDGYRQTVIDIRAMSVELEVNRAASRLITVLGAMIADQRDIA